MTRIQIAFAVAGVALALALAAVAVNRQMTRGPVTEQTDGHLAPAPVAPTPASAPVVREYGPAPNNRAPGPAPAARVSDAVRRDALRRASVWRSPHPESPAPWSAATAAHPLECRFVVNVPGGTTWKFDCALPGGRTLRVKYGRGPERHAEAAASSLLSRLGFGTDRVLMIERLRCHGCPWNPYITMKAAGLVSADALYARVVDYGRHVDFDWVSIEERFPGDAIESADTEGWAWFELEEATRDAGGARRAQVDALRLLAVFLAHWDNKSENQRLVCVPGGTSADGRCAAPFALVQDLGATFGPRKVDLDAWREALIWTDRATCEVSMLGFPYGGGTFRPGRISESGRRFLGDLLAGLSEQEIDAIFRAARFEDYSRLLAPRAPVTEWVAVFRNRVRQITSGPPCPTT